MSSRGANLLSEWMAGDPTSRSQARIARELSVSQASVSRWLNGERPRMSVILAQAIERLTGGAVPITTWAEPPSPVAPKANQTAAA